ncbi:hypothetical protein QYM36_002295 [Artemia franciscana]|uniref:Uncharacterized protein n=1 Tax=Artemia franciscana TaxID=6661 RepID=A0AA88IGQ4_ARTSF|nr:hypothetical protein QYM36_002295 [Artemia franciscana]
MFSLSRLRNQLNLKIQSAFSDMNCIVFVDEGSKLSLKLNNPVIKITNKEILKQMNRRKCPNVVVATPNISVLDDVFLKLHEKKVILSTDRILIITWSKKTINKRLLEKFIKISVFTIKDYRLRIFSQVTLNLQGSTKLRPVLNSSQLESQLFDNTLDLENSTFRVGTFHFPPSIVYSEKTDSYSGIDVEIAKFYSFALRTNLRFQQPTDGEMWGRATNDSRIYTGNTGLVYWGTVDAGIAGYFLMLERSVYVDFTYPHAFDIFSAIVPPRMMLPQWQNFLSPLNATVWAGILVLVFMCTGILITLIKLYRLFNKDNLGFLEHPLNSAIYNLQALLANAASIDGIKKWHIKTFVAFLWAAYFFITASYRANLLAQLATPLYQPPMDTFQKIYESGLPIVSTGDEFREKMRQSNLSAIRGLANNYMNSYDIPGTIKDVNDRKLVYMGAKYGLLVITETMFTDQYGKARLHIIGEYFTSYHIVMYTPLNSPLTEILKPYTIRIVQGGFPPYWKNKGIEAAKEVTNISKVSEPEINSTVLVDEKIKTEFPQFIEALDFVAISNGLDKVSYNKWQSWKSEIVVIDCIPLVKLLRKYEVSKERKITIICAVENICKFGNREKDIVSSLKSMSMINSFLMTAKSQRRVSIILIDIHTSLENKMEYLKGKYFPTTVTQSLPFIEIKMNATGDQTIDGSLWEIKALLEEKLKIQLKIELILNKTGYNDEDGDYNYGLDTLTSGEAELDLTVQGLTEQKIRDFDYVSGIGGSDAGEVSFLTRYPREGDSVKLFAVLHPFSTSTWMLIAAMTGIMVLLTWCLIALGRRLYKTTPSDLKRNDYSLLKVGMSMLGIVLSRSGLPVPTTSAVRVAVGFWCLITVTIGGLYIRSFQAAAVAPVPVVGPLTTKDLVEGKYKFVPKTGQIRNWMESRNDGFAKIIAATVKTENVELKDTLDSVLDKRYAFFASRPSLRTLVGKDRQETGYCRFWQGDEFIYKSMGVLMLRKNSSLTKPLQVMVVRLVESGIIHKLLENYTFQIYADQCKQPYLLSKGKPYSLKDLVSAFSLFAFSIAVASLIFALEMVSSYCSEIY